VWGKAGIRQDACIGVETDLIRFTQELLQVAPQRGPMRRRAYRDVPQRRKSGLSHFRVAWIIGTDGINQSHEKTQCALGRSGIRAF
jgi:hypothetical protein